VDYHGASEDKEDFMCIHPLNANGKLMTDENGDTAATCHFDDHLDPHPSSRPQSSKEDLTHNANQQESFDAPLDAGGKQYRRAANYYTAVVTARAKPKKPSSLRIPSSASNDHEEFFVARRTSFVLISGKAERPPSAKTMRCLAMVPRIWAIPLSGANLADCCWFDQL